MSCAKFIGNIILSLYGELSTKESARLDRHLEECASCRLEKERLAESIRIFRKGEMPEPSLSSREALLYFARERLSSGPSASDIIQKLKGRFIFRVLRPAVAVLVLLILASVYMFRERSLPSSPELPPEDAVIFADGFLLSEAINDLSYEVEVAELTQLFNSGNLLEEDVTGQDSDLSLNRGELKAPA